MDDTSKNSTSHSRIKMFEDSDEQNIVNEMMNQLDNSSVEIPLIKAINFESENPEHQITLQIGEQNEVELAKESQEKASSRIESSYVLESQSEQIQNDLIQKQEDCVEENQENKITEQKAQIIESSEQISLQPAKEDIIASSNPISNQQSEISPSDQNTQVEQNKSQKNTSKKLNLTNMLNMDFGAYQSKFEQAQKSKVAAPFKITPLIGMGFQPALQKSESMSSIRPYIQQLKETEEELKNQMNERDHDFDDLMHDTPAKPQPQKPKQVPTTYNATKSKLSAQNIFITYLQTGIFHCFAHLICEISRLATSYFQLKHFGTNYYKQFVIYDTFLNTFIWFTLVQGQRISSEQAQNKPRIIEQIFNGLLCSIVMLCFLPLLPRIKEFYPQLIVQILIYPTKKSVQEEIVLCANKQHLLHFSSIILPQLLRFTIEVNNYYRHENKNMIINTPTLIAQTIADIVTILWFIYLHTGRHFLSFVNKTLTFDFKQTCTEFKLSFKKSIKDFQTMIHTIILGFPFFHLFINARDTNEDFPRLYLFYSSVSISYKTLAPLIYSHNLVIKDNQSEVHSSKYFHKSCISWIHAADFQEYLIQQCVFT
ncbi:Transmembrane_domain-containing protein [Hexamita inflata]|uniref:Transmembrane domain-containing protein n=1 Tax=Hexamita inflata TaxID=28002 RepID=A0AA86NF20_9EUKA|nr:Transmembrane domain-containing protein [Hexamita inflata]CAI9940072.1 Transmembrane domain-containing protein [Hexamita inflata]